MVNVCCVPGCKTGYKCTKNSHQSSEAIPLFKFPVDPILKKKWINAITRQDWTVLPNHPVCVKHFAENDVIKTSTDQCKDRADARPTKNLQRLRLKPNVIPHIFQSLPIYLSKQNPVPRPTSSATAAARVEKRNNDIVKQTQFMFQNESFYSYEHFIKMIKNEILPSGFISVSNINCMYFYFIKQYDDLTVAPSLLASVFVDVNLEIKVFIFSKLMPNVFYRHLLLLPMLHSTSELKNILSLCKSVCDSSKDFISSNSCLSLVVNLLELYQSSLTDHESLSLIRFGIEQLQLLQVQKHGRRYSVELITTAFLWQLTSTACYRKIRQVLILPSSSRLRQFSAGSDVSTSIVDLKYLKLQSEGLSAQEKIVVLLLDEV